MEPDNPNLKVYGQSKGSLESMSSIGDEDVPLSLVPFRNLPGNDGSSCEAGVRRNRCPCGPQKLECYLHEEHDAGIYHTTTRSLVPLSSSKAVDGKT